MKMNQGLVGRGHFQWNTAAWFGSQFGATVWLLTMCVMYWRDPLVLPVGLATFVTLNAAGYALWRRRDRIPPFKAALLLLAVDGAAVVPVLARIWLSGRAAQWPPGWHLSGWEFGVVIGVFGIVTAQFCFMEWWARRERRLARQ